MLIKLSLNIRTRGQIIKYKKKVEKIQNDIDKIQAKVEEVKQKHSTILSSAQTDDSKITFILNLET